MTTMPRLPGVLRRLLAALARRWRAAVAQPAGPRQLVASDWIRVHDRFFD